ncbi:ATP-grasp domain-containing protein [Streptomyces ziwulingensis]|uniref:ATP-grasp domain-containing protein n=1 Tax=Streptomyces ziwulingensis TaxID=1045501 RepID=A0ABP9C328_9ACTN
MHIVLVETTSVRGFDMVAEMADAGIEVSFVTGDLDAYRGKPGFEPAARAARLVEVETPAAGRLAERLRGRLGPHRPDGVICRDEVYPFAVAELARDLGLPHESVAAARTLSDKAAVRARLTEHGVGSLRWRVAATLAQGLAAVDEIGLPVVVKPTAGGWSVGVTIAWNRTDAARALSEVLGVPAGRDGAPPRALVEEYAVGRHVSAELLVQGERVVLLGFAERLPAPPGQAAELGGHFPARPAGEGAARGFVLAAVRALGLRASAVHAELLLTPTGPEMIEVNGRIAGHVVTRQMSYALGRSLTRDLVALAVGDEVEEAAPPETVVALHQLHSPVPAVVRGTKPADVLGPDVIETHLTVAPGDRVRALRTNHDRIGYVLARGATGERAARTAASAAERLLASLELRPEPATGTPRAPAGSRSGSRSGSPSGSLSGSPGGSAGGSPGGEHLLVLLGADDPVEPTLTAVGAVTSRVSVVWTSGPEGEAGAETETETEAEAEAEAEARALWARHCHGQWHRAGTGAEVRAAARLVHAAERVRGVLTLSSTPFARQLRDGGPGPTGNPPPRPGQGGGPAVAGAAPPAAGHTVVVTARRGEVRALAVLDEEPSARLCPSALDARRSALLVERAVRAVREARVDGVVRCFFPDRPRLPAATGTGLTDSSRADADTDADVPPTGAPLLLFGLDGGTIDLYDATHTRGLVAAVTEAALGRAPRGAARGTVVAVQRALPLPAGPLRVVEASTAAELGARPEVFRARVFTRAGDVTGAAGSGVWLRHTVVAVGREEARAAAARLEGSLVLRTTPRDRTHVLLLDRLGAGAWTTEDGSAPVLPADRFRLTVLTSADDAPGPADLSVRTDLYDDFALAHLARAVHAAYPVHRVAALSERLLEPAARLRRLLGTPGEGPDEVRRFVDKAVMKRLARRHGIRCADGLLAHTAEDVRALLRRHGRIVCKPRAASGSQGVAVLTSEAELERWLRAEFVPGTQVCEEFVDAPMCHIDAVVHRGETVWNVSAYVRDTMALRRGRPLSSVTVADPAVRAAAGRLLGQVVDGWRVRSGVLHLEAFLTPAGPTFCEVAARPGGGGVVESFRATDGVDLRHAKILADAGENPFAGRRDPVAAYAGWTVHYCEGGRLLAYDDSSVAPHAHSRTVRARVGDTVPASTFSGTGVSTHVFVHHSPDGPAALVDRAEREVRIVTGPVHEAARP